MNCQEYIKELQDNTKTEDILKISSVENIYGKINSELVKKIISSSDQTKFFDNNIRSLSFEEIIEAEKDLHTDFTKKHLLPLFDLGDNDFIVYQLSSNTWADFNITDEIMFNTTTLLNNLLQ